MAMLERAGQDACRPDDLPEIYGLREGLYHLLRNRPRRFWICACTV